mmetsp:Transcript_73287/g.85140  ORF Transcript_73287/g.85140 Transcript_73287/m.85140 type:complete len:378 (+) Transcript_73287:50-1183(+)
MKSRMEEELLEPDYKIKTCKVPYKYKVATSKEEGFDIKYCMKGFKLDPEAGYEKNADYYFDSYAHFDIHEQMLKDEARTLGYMNAIRENPELFKGKIVMDIGCGTGVLSIFAAQAGAKHVYGIECAGIANHARNIIKDNGYEDKITIIRGKVEEISLPVDQVDVIISEWMGYFLLYESMLDSVLFARDKWLSEDGILLPDRAVLYLAGIEDSEYKSKKIDFWDNVYGINMGRIKKWALLEPLVDFIEKEQINTDACAILDIDIKTVKVKDLDFASEYRLTAKRNDKIHAYVAWFDTFFGKGKKTYKISTSPLTTRTHWKQTVFYLNDVITVQEGEEVRGSIAVRKGRENIRELDVKISYHFMNESDSTEGVQFYKIR